LPDGEAVKRLFDPSREPRERVRDDDWFSPEEPDPGWKELFAYDTVESSEAVVREPLSVVQRGLMAYRAVKLWGRRPNPLLYATPSLVRTATLSGLQRRSSSKTRSLRRQASVIVVR
jgi:hypothetical protein